MVQYAGVQFSAGFNKALENMIPQSTHLEVNPDVVGDFEKNYQPVLPQSLLLRSLSKHFFTHTKGFAS